MEISKRKYQDIVHKGEIQNCPLSFQQERVLYLSQLQPKSTLWNRVYCKRIKGEIHVPLLNKAIEDLISRHSVLKTKVRFVNNSPVQSLFTTMDHTFQTIDLSHLDESQRESEAISLVNKEYQDPIHVIGGQLFKFVLIMLSETDYMLILKLHHIISTRCVDM